MNGYFKIKPAHRIEISNFAREQIDCYQVRLLFVHPRTGKFVSWLQFNGCTMEPKGKAFSITVLAYKLKGIDWGKRKWLQRKVMEVGFGESGKIEFIRIVKDGDDSELPVPASTL